MTAWEQLINNPLALGFLLGTGQVIGVAVSESVARTANHLMTDRRSKEVAFKFGKELGELPKWLDEKSWEIDKSLNQTTGKILEELELTSFAKELNDKLAEFEQGINREAEKQLKEWQLTPLVKQLDSKVVEFERSIEDNFNKVFSEFNNWVDAQNPQNSSELKHSLINFVLTSSKSTSVIWNPHWWVKHPITCPQSFR